MSKTLKISMLILIIALGTLFLLGTRVNAVEVNSEEAFKEAWMNGTDATITLTGDIETDIVELCELDYVLDLNGHTLTAVEFYVNDGSLTINDSKGNGKLNASYMMVCEGAKAVINNGIFTDGKSPNLIDNSGTLTINNGTFHSIWNFGTLTINDGKFANISSDEGTLYIKGGTFTSYKFSEKLEDGTIGEMDYFSMFNIKSSTIVITGGEFKTDGINEALRIYGNNEYDVNENSINDIIGKGYVAQYNVSNCTSWETSYSSVKVVKDETDTILNKIAPNGVWTIDAVKPTSVDESDSILTSIANDIDMPKGYEIQAWCNGMDNMDPESVHINVLYNGRILVEKDVKAVYKEPTKEVVNDVTPVIEKITDKIGTELDTEKAFLLDDLNLINYLNTAKGEFDASVALNFSKELIELTNGSNISYKFDTRCGDSGNDLWSYLGGTAVVFYDGAAVDTTKIGLRKCHVLYVPVETKDTDEAKIAAALKRIEEYLGTTTGIKISVGKTLESISNEEYDWNEFDFFDEKTSGTNYFNVTINGETYKFVISKSDKVKEEAPKYVGSNLGSNITITSDDTTIPLDTAITAKKVEKEIIKNTLGTDKYEAYDISLYSNAKQTNITKLENSKFEVSLPIPESLKGKDITVYYITDAGEKEEHTATIKGDDMLTFETNHFSTYVVAEKVVENNKQEDKGEKDESPDTGYTNTINYVLATTIISALGIVILKRKDK